MDHIQIPLHTEGSSHMYLLELESIPSCMPPISAEPNLIPVHILTNDFQYSSHPYSMPILPASMENQKVETNINGSVPLNEFPHTNTRLPQINENSSHRDIQESIKIEIDIPLNLAQTTTLSDKSKTVFEANRCPKIQNYVHISDRSVPPRAVAVLPPALLLRRHVISPRRSLPACVRFGPVEGVHHKVNPTVVQEMVTKSAETKSPLFLLKKNEHTIYIDVSDKDKSNWLSLLPLGDEKTANVWLYEDNNELYAITTQPVATRKPLLLGYSKQYAKDHGFTIEQPILDIEADLLKTAKKWWCYKCEQGMVSPSLLLYHINTHHQDKIPVSRPRYKCRQCTRKFTRIFTLKRHMAQNCLKKPEKLVTNQNNVNSKADDALYTGTSSIQLSKDLEESIEDNRAPSDESFQNYTNGLEFSTNLFDTDRIPSLDISGNSRSEGEFNSFAMGYKDENYLANDLGFCKVLTVSEVSQSNTEDRQKSIDPNQVSSQICNTTVTKEKKSHNVRCRAQRFECDCGHSYTNKKRLAQHIFTKHSKEFSTKTNTINTPNRGKSYECDLCQHGFKRRGMLVNHLVRVHNSTSPTVPLQKRIRHYLCVACPKMYRTAAKRDRHIRNHHPGAEKQSGQIIEGALHTCEPAVCTACPRQYVTRAKLLQHVRLHHPDLAASIKCPKSKSSETDKQHAVPEEELKRSALQPFLSFY